MKIAVIATMHVEVASTVDLLFWSRTGFSRKIKARHDSELVTTHASFG